MRFVAFVILGLFSFNLWAAELKVVATTSSMGMLARTVGGEHVSVETLAPPDRDAHFLQAKPSMMKDLRRADLVVAVGAELEVGWLPLAIQRANNPRIQPGQNGYFEAAAQVVLNNSGGVADRSLGDVHPAGNPHVNLDPQRMGVIAQALAARLGELDGAHAEAYRRRADAFTAQVAERLPQWRAQVKNAPGVVLYHKDANYLMALLEVPILGYIEPVAGVPPTASYLQKLVGGLKGKSGVIIRSLFHSPQGADFLHRELGWPVAALPIDPALGKGSEAYLTLIEQWVTAIAQGRRATLPAKRCHYIQCS